MSSCLVRYGVDLLWKLIQSNDPSITPAISQLAASSLAQLLAAPEIKSQLLVYLDKCIGVLIPTSPISSVVPALKLAEIILSQQADVTTKTSLARSDLIVQLEQDHRILQSMMEEIVRYHRYASEVVAKQGVYARTCVLVCMVCAWCVHGVLGVCVVDAMCPACAFCSVWCVVIVV